MILPTKHLSPDRSLIGVGGQVITHLTQPKSVVALWDASRQAPGVATFERFILALDLLYLLGLVDIQDNLVYRAKQ